MSRKNGALTPEQVRQRFRARGETLTQWAAAHGYDRAAVYRVMGGQDKARYGRAHEIAVALGLKVLDDVDCAPAKPSTPADGRNAQSKRAA